jgi:hypothetical protein
MHYVSGFCAESFHELLFKKVGLPGTLKGCTGMVPRLFHGRRSSNENLLGGFHLTDPKLCSLELSTIAGDQTSVFRRIWKR